MIPLPVSILAERYRVAAWPILVAIGAVAGGVIMPAFLHWLEARGHISMWPGAGSSQVRRLPSSSGASIARRLAIEGNRQPADWLGSRAFIR